MAVKPKLSILLPGMFGFESIRPALQAWLTQSSLSHIEILLLLPAKFSLTKDQRAKLPSQCREVKIGEACLHEGRAHGIKVAAGQYIVLAEDHCLPDEDWCEVVLRRIEQGWDGIGSVLRPGNRKDCWSEASFLIGYGEWMWPHEGGTHDILCGMNCTVRTELLRKFGEDLASELVIGAFMMRKLKEQGARFYIDVDAGMRHYDRSGLVQMKLIMFVGLGFGAVRTETWSWPMRFLYPIALPAIAFLHSKRALTQHKRAGRACGLRRTTPIASVALACGWAVGEAAGAVAGRFRILPHLWKIEIKPVSQESIDQSDAFEAGMVKLAR